MIDLTILLEMTSVSDWFSAATFFDWFINHAGYLMVFVFMAIESSFIPFPSEVIIPPAAYLACAQGSTSDMNIFMVVLVATAGAIVGALVNYYLSVFIGRPIVYKFADSRFGHACLIDRQKVDRAEKYFDEHGAISTFIGRLIPAVRQLISIPAGLARMNIGKFILFTGLGAMVWNAILALLGWWLAKAVPLSQLFDMVEKYNKYLTYFGLAIGVVCLGIILWNAFKPRKNNEIA